MSDENTNSDNLDSISYQISNFVMNTQNEEKRNSVKQLPLNLLADHLSIKVNKNVVLKITNDSKNLNKDVKNSCKILHFSSESSFKEVLVAIGGLEPKDYPHLFIFVIHVVKLSSIDKKVEKLKKKLLKFGPKRPLLVQLTSEDENFSIFYYKEEHSNSFLAWYPSFWKTNEKLSNLLEFLNIFLNEKFENFENEILDVFATIQNRSTFLRFLWTLDLSDNFFRSMIANVASNGTEFEFLAALDAPCESEGRFFNIKALKYIRNSFGEDVDTAKHKSVLLTAVENRNIQVIEYLIDNWSHLVQEFPFENQVSISAAAFETGQLDVLCDLLEYADHPFPDNFKSELIQHERLEAIIEERRKLEAAIKDEKIHEIIEFINENSHLKIVYNINNKSALKQAVDASKIKVYAFLKLRDFHSTNQSENFEEADKELEKYVAQQRKQNINEGLLDDQRAVNLLCSRSLIHNKRISKEQEKEYRQKIRSWFKDINKIKNGAEFLNVAASCDKLKILFDFENETVENTSLAGSNASGSTYPSSKWIFIGAKLSDKNREQKIKGILTHELCHYVMKLVYENQEKPYFEYREDLKEMFEEIVKAIDKWSAEDSENPDDECNGVISSVFKAYDAMDFHPELIARVVQILAEFDCDKMKREYLLQKYKILYDFWDNHVILELRWYSPRNQKVRKLNKNEGLLVSFLKNQIETKVKIDIEKIIDNRTIIVLTNHPKLFFVDVCRDLKQTHRFLTTIFIKLNSLLVLQNHGILEEICSEIDETNVFVDCSEDIPNYLDNIFVSQKLNFIFVASNKQKCEKINRIIRRSTVTECTAIEINYHWHDIQKKSQDRLLQTEFHFNSNIKFPLENLLKSATLNQENVAIKGLTKCEETVIRKQFDEIIDDIMLNMMIENQSINIYSDLQHNNKDKIDDLILKPRNFVNKSSLEKITGAELLSEVKNDMFILISDSAGHGKTFTMKMTGKAIGEQNPTRWVTYVDLKQYIHEFEDDDGNKKQPNFETFIPEYILKIEKSFKLKIYQTLYQIGKVTILFDGYDEIAPDYKKFVLKLAQSFKYNGGNQLWIASRDYYEDCLKESLPVNKSFKIDELSEENGIDLIVRNSSLANLDYGKITTNEELDEFINGSQFFKEYRLKVTKIIKKISFTKVNYFECPEAIKTMVDYLDNNLKKADHWKRSDLFDTMKESLFIIWTSEKGKICEATSIDSQDFALNFTEIHQYHAISCLFPEQKEQFFPDYTNGEWSNEDIIGCGVIKNFNNGTACFVSDLLRDYFIFDFINEKFISKRLEVNILTFFVRILTSIEFEGIQAFFNDMDKNVLLKLEPKIHTHVENFLNMKNFASFFKNDFNNLIEFVISILTKGQHGRVKQMLQEMAPKVSMSSASNEVFVKFQSFLLETLQNRDELKKLIEKAEMFLKLIQSKLDMKIFDEFLTKVADRTGSEFIKDVLKIGSRENLNGNIFHYLCLKSNLAASKVQEFLKIIKKYLDYPEILKLMQKCNKNDQNVLQVCIRTGSPQILTSIWTGIGQFLSKADFKELVTQKTSFNWNILHYAASCEDIKFHEDLWTHLLMTFTDLKELMDLLIHDNKLTSNFTFYILESTKSAEIMELTFKILKDKSKDQFNAILKSHDQYGRNLLQFAVLRSNDIKTHEILWENFQQACNPDQLVKVFGHADNNGCNVLYTAARSSTCDVFSFLENIIGRQFSYDIVRSFLITFDTQKLNILMQAVKFNKSIELHENLWTFLLKYLFSSELSEIIKFPNDKDENLFTVGINYASQEIFELTLDKIILILETRDNVKQHFQIDENFLNKISIQHVSKAKYEYLKKLSSNVLEI